jgi:hypothetical protein
MWLEFLWLMKFFNHVIYQYFFNLLCLQKLYAKGFWIGLCVGVKKKKIVMINKIIGFGDLKKKKILWVK